MVAYGVSVCGKGLETDNLTALHQVIASTQHLHIGKPVGTINSVHQGFFSQGVTPCRF